MAIRRKTGRTEPTAGILRSLTGANCSSAHPEPVRRTSCRPRVRNNGRGARVRIGARIVLDPRSLFLFALGIAYEWIPNA